MKNKSNSKESIKHEESSILLTDLIEFVKSYGDHETSQKDIAKRINVGETILSREKNWKNGDASRVNPHCVTAPISAAKKIIFAKNCTNLG